jgi:serine/threonine-protein kinase
VQGFRLPLAARLFLASGLLVTLAVAAAALVVVLQGERSGALAVERSLSEADAAQQRFEALSFDKLALVAGTLAADADFARYVAAATDLGTGLGTAPLAPADSGLAATDESDEPTLGPVAGDTASVKDLLEQNRETYGFGFGMVLDPEGLVVARTDEREAFQDSFAEDPVFGPMIATAEGVTGYWRDAGKLYQVVAGALAPNEDVVGYLVVGMAVDDSIARQVREVSGGEVVFWIDEPDGERLVANSFGEGAVTGLATALGAKAQALAAAMDDGSRSARVDLELDDQHWVGRVSPMYGQPGEAIGGVLTLTSADAAMAPFESIQRSVWIGGGVALVLALAVSWWLARRVLQPVAELTDAAEKAAAGNYQQRLDIEGNDEVARLGRAVDSLLSDLREQQDIEGYVGHLSRFLPDPGAEAPLAPRPAAKPATRSQMTLAGLELRRFLKTPPAGEEAITLTALGQLVEEAQAQAQAAGGDLLEQEGPRLLFGFGGQDADMRALATVHAWRAGRIGSTDNGAAYALASGEIVHGSLPARPEGSATIGLPVLHVERLLAETPSGLVLVTPAIGERLKQAGHVAALRAAVGQASGKRFFAVDAAALADLARNAPGVALATVPNAGSATLSNASHATPPAERGATRLASGMRFAGRYEILAILGSGGMGVVYKARDLELNDVVALKMLRPGMMADAEQLEQFKSEIKLARRITHPNVLRTFDFGEFQGAPYISMEYVRGLTLRYLLQQTGRLPYSAALRIGRQLGMGLDAAHQVGVIHRDIKPENLIIEQSGNAKLMDFGIARPASRRGDTEQGLFLGTPSYASPEQFSGLQLDARADLYSTGVLLCEMFCGQLPFKGTTTMELYMAHLQQPPTRPSVLWPDIPRPLEAIILKCLEKKPADRYASAAELLADLGGLRA